MNPLEKSEIVFIQIFNMSVNLFIPKKIVVGFQKRDETFTGKLAYIIYYDEKGKLRKEASWNSWRHKDIEPIEYDNTPQSNMTLNKDIKRYNWGHFSSNRTMIRVHDDRGFEFEVTTENLIAILMHNDCSKRSLSGEFVYAWHGTELVLLPTNSEQYENSVKYTQLQDQKISAKELLIGGNYKTKRDGNITYVGRHHWYDWTGKNQYYSDKESQWKGKKYHIFTRDDGESFITKSDVSFLAELNSPEPVANYADIFDKFQKKMNSSNIVGWEMVPTEFNEKLITQYSSKRFKQNKYFIDEPELGTYREITTNTVGYGDRNASDQDIIERGVNIEYSYRYFPKENKKQMIYFNRNYYRWNRKQEQLTLNMIKSIKLFDLYAVLENGRKIKLAKLNDEY